MHSQHQNCHQQMAAKELPAVTQMRSFGDRWVCWKYSKRGGEITKPPYQTNGLLAENDNLHTWDSFENCRDAMHRFNGIGIVLGDLGDGKHLVGVDLDNGVDPDTGEPREWAKREIERFNSYTEISPSKTGYKIYALADSLPTLPSKKLVIREAPDEHHHEQVEVFPNGRYFALTGLRVTGTPDTLEDSTEALAELAAELAKAKAAKAAKCGTVASKPKIASGKMNGSAAPTETDPSLPIAFRLLLTEDPELRAAWEHGNEAEPIGDRKGNTANELDWALAKYLGPHLADDDLRTVLVAHVHGQIGSGKITDTKLITRRLEQLLERGRTYRARAEENPRELVLTKGNRVGILSKIERQSRQAENLRHGSIFNRGGARVVLRFQQGRACLEAAGPIQVQHALDSTFNCVVYDAEGNAKAVDTPINLATYVHGNAAFPSIRGIANAPFMRADGTIHDAPGYDPATQLFLTPMTDFKPVKDEPTQQDAAEALERLRKPFRAFPFVTPEDRDAVVAKVLTIMTRHLMPVAPAYGINAKAAGTGKGKLFKTAAWIATGAEPPAGIGDVIFNDEELRKSLTSSVLAAKPLVFFDNLTRNRPVKSPTLEAFITTALYTDRLLGSSTTISGENSAVVVLTGNSLEITGDLTRRVLRIDLDAKCEQPDERDFAFDCEAEVKRDRAELVQAALTLLRAHAVAGWPRAEGCKSVGSFEEWSRLVADAICFAGGVDVRVLFDRLKGADPEKALLRQMIEMLDDVTKGVPTLVSAVMDRAENAAMNASLDELDEKADYALLLEQLGGRNKSAITLGKRFAGQVGRPVDGRMIVRETSRTNTALYTVRAAPELSEEGV